MIVTSGFPLIFQPHDIANHTPQGYDVSVAKIESFGGGGVLGKNEKQLPQYIEAPRGPLAGGSQAYFLRPGAYLVTFAEVVSVPTTMVGFMWARSTLLRMGASFNTAVWDAGYRGIGQSLLVVHNPMGIEVEVGSRIGQMVFAALDADVQPYAGQYQWAGLEEEEVV
jgi:deoxycytidine triphosphate deaminase